jgi:hypothetical protein
MGIVDKIKGWFAKDDTAADGGETSGEASGKPAETKAAPGTADTAPGDAGGSSDPTAT